MAEYYNVTTNLGDAEIANAIATNTKLNITHIAFGDGNGSVPTPNKARTSLVREVHRQAVTKYERHATNTNWIVIETIIPSDIGGFTIREMGIIGNGKLISHGSHVPFEKVADPSGVSEYRLKFTQNITDGNVVSITLDDSLIYATQAWVEENFIKRNEIIDDLTTDDATKPVSAAQAKLLNETKLSKSLNLSDLQSASAARSNLGLGTAATRNVATSNTDVSEQSAVMNVGFMGLGCTKNDSWVSYPGYSSSPLTDMTTQYPTGFYTRLGYYSIEMRGIERSWFSRLIMPYNNNNVVHHPTFVIKGGTGTTVFTLKSDKNTTIDSNGFIKAASPIVNLYADKIDGNPSG